MLKHAPSVNKLQLGLYGSNRGLKATGDMFTTRDEKAMHTVVGSMRMAFTLHTHCRAIPCASKTSLACAFIWLVPTLSLTASCPST